MDYYEAGERILTACPVHGGKYQSSFNINVNPESDYYGKWFCNSDGCHKKFGNDLVGLTWGLMSYENSGATFVDAIDYCKKLCADVKGDFHTSKSDTVTNFLLKKPKQNTNLLSREQVRQRLKIPSTYYINRGFSPEILDEFDIGYCEKDSSPFYGRVVFPVYSPDGKWMVGATGRRTTDGPNKWINSKGFSKSSYLYAFNRAIKRAKEVGAIILVEGQGDVLRMHEAGIINTVGLFGCDISDSQEFLLQKSGVMDIVLALDNNEAGQKGNERISERLRNLFNVHVLVPTKNDIGDMKVNEVKELVQKIRKYI